MFNLERAREEIKKFNEEENHRYPKDDVTVDWTAPGRFKLPTFEKIL